LPADAEGLTDGEILRRFTSLEEGQKDMLTELRALPEKLSDLPFVRQDVWEVQLKTLKEADKANAGAIDRIHQWFRWSIQGLVAAIFTGAITYLVYAAEIARSHH